MSDLYTTPWTDRFFNPNPFYDPRSVSSSPSVVYKTYGDVTGDGKTDEVLLTGIKTADSPFVKDITLHVRKPGTSADRYSISLPEKEGYNPTLTLADFTGSGHPDILVQIDSGGSGGTTYDNIYHFAAGGFKPIFNSNHFNEQWKYKVDYLDQYRLQVTSGANGLKYTIDIRGRGKEYLDEIYNADGTLKKPVQGFVDPISGLYPVDLDRDGKYSVMVFQQVSGLYHADSFGYIVSVLTYSGGSWKLEQQWFASYGM